MFKNVRKWAIALVLVFGLFLLVGCQTECPECEDPTESECNELFPCEEPADPTEAECEALYPSEECPVCEVCEECEECPEVPECKQDFVAPTSIILFGDDVKVTETFNLAEEMEVAPATATKLFTWTSSDPSIATVDANGVVTGVRPGKVEITAKSVLKDSVVATTEVTVSETGAAFDIATREVAYIANLLSGYIADDFALPQPWNGNAKVVYDVDGDVIESFVMPDLGEATSLSYTVNYTVTFGDITLSNTVNLKLVDEIEDNDFAKVDAAIEVATKLFSNITAGVGTDKISADIQLPPSYDGVAYNWTTNKNYILTNDGKFTRPDNDTTVTYTISPKSGAAARSATLTFTINGYTAAEKQAFNVEEGVFAGIEGATVSSSFLLPTQDEKFGITYDYVLPTGLTKGAYTGNGKYIKVVYDNTTEKANAEIGVVARYEEEAGFQFIENFKLKVNLVPGNDANADVEAFLLGTDGSTITLDTVTTLTGLDLANVLHMPYGANGTETMLITLPTIVGTSTTVAWAADENFEATLTAGQFKLVTQYFRYHEAKLTATFTNGTDKLTVVFFINVGLAEKPLTYYQGGRSNSYQASANPAKRGDMLQGFSYWDKYVGTVASSAERTNQYWSEFSGYTLWIDETVSYVSVKVTKSSTGVITATPTAATKTIRYQLFPMEFEVNRIYKYDTYEGQNVPRVDVRYARATYGGNFNHFLVNETDSDLDIPVSSLSMGGYFADGETAMKTYSLTSLVIKDDGTDKKDTTVEDDYGSSYKVSREQTIAYDGYRPGFSLKSNGTAALVEGAKDTYDFYMGSTVKQHLTNTGAYAAAAVAAQEVATSTQYFQYCISPALSAVYKTPYAIIGAGSYAFQWHSQGYYSLSADFTRAMTGGVRGTLMNADGTVDADQIVDAADDFYAPAQVTVARYTRHVNNEELTDYFVRAVAALSTDYSDVSQSQIDAYKAVQNMISGASGFNDPAWLASWLAKTATITVNGVAISPKAAKATLDQIEIDTEAAALKQKQFAESVHDKIDALAAIHAAGGYKNAASYVATVAFKDVNNVSYAAAATVPANTIVTSTTWLTLGADQVKFAPDASDAARVAVLKSREATTLMADADTLYAALTPGRLSFIDATIYAKLTAAKVELQINALSDTAALANATAIAAAKTAYSDLSAAAQGLITTTNVDKINGLTLAIKLLSLPGDSSVTVGSTDQIVAARTAYDSATAAEKVYVNKVSGLAATIATKEGKLATAYKAQTVSLVASIKAAAVILLDDDTVDIDNLTAAQLATLTNALKDFDSLIAAYKTLYDSSVLQTKVVTVYYYNSTTAAITAYTTVDISALSTSSAATLTTAIAFIETEKIKSTLDTSGKTVIDTTFGMMSDRDDRGRIADLYDAMDDHNGARADEVEDIIDALPAERALVVEDEAKIQAARDAYTALSTAQKALVTPSRLTDLSDLELAIVDVKLEAIALPVDELIYALPNRIALTDAEAVAAARAAYNALTPKQKAKVNGLSELVDAETDIATLQAEAAADSAAVAAVIKDLTGKLYDQGNANCKVTSANVATIKAYITAFDALLGYEQAYILGLSGLTVGTVTYANFAARLALYREAIAKVEFFTPIA